MRSEMRPLRSGARPSAPPAMRVTRQYIRPPVGRTGAQKRKQRGVRAGVEKCREPISGSVTLDLSESIALSIEGGPPHISVRAGVAVCGEVLKARRGWLRCPVHGNG